MGRSHALAKVLLFVVALLPFCWLLWSAIYDQLGPNPAEHLIRATGDWTLRFLCLTLAITPLRVILRRPVLARYRRMAGLFVYFYAVLHLLCYSGFDMGFELHDILKDVAKRPFILVGSLAFALLTPLAATSFDRAIIAMGGRQWQILHRSVYVVAGLAILHFFWMRSGKNNYAEVFIYALVLGGLLLWRVRQRLMRLPASRP